MGEGRVQTGGEGARDGQREGQRETQSQLAFEQEVIAVGQVAGRLAGSGRQGVQPVPRLACVDATGFGLRSCIDEMLAVNVSGTGLDDPWGERPSP
jgi:hypothetical protein